MIESFKVKSNIPNLLLVTDWDRFGRNAENAFDMILMLGRYDIKIQAINELLDLTVPENKLLYAIYLSAKGDSKLFHSLRIKKGIRIAKENKLKMKSQ
jgi:DNA invertase Pin-like site-specific DNA recombinase